MGEEEWMKKEADAWKSEDWGDLRLGEHIHLYADYYVTCQEPLPSPGREPDETEGYGTLFVAVVNVQEYTQDPGAWTDYANEKLRNHFGPLCSWNIERVYYHATKRGKGGK